MRFYGGSVLGLTPGQKMALQMFMPGVCAEEILRERGGEMSAQSVYKAVLLASGSKDEAETAMSRRVLEEEMRRKAAGGA